MIETKVKVPQDSLLYKYNKDFDVLDVFIGKVVPSISDELYYGIYSYLDAKTENIVGISIMDYKKRDKDFISNLLPFDINFDYIDRNVVN